MPRHYWLVKSEPGAYSWSDFVGEGGTCWDGVRNHTARRNLESMRAGDLVLFYHSVKEKAVVGVARVTRESYPDPTARGPRWRAVDLEPVRALERPVELATIKAEAALAEIPLVRQSRLSVMPLPRPAFQRILRLGKTRL
jgi:predicted RNA-binding protein with PUA-like domain